MITRWLPLATAIAPVAAAAEPWQDARSGPMLGVAAGGGVLYHGPWGLLLSILDQSKDVQRFSVPVPALDVDAGAWLTPQLALSLHAVAMPFRSSKLATPTEPAVRQTVADAFVGGSLQYWMAPLHGSVTDEPSLWLAGGAGVSLLANGGHTGLGLDVRGGYALGGGFQISVEGTEGLYLTGPAKFTMLTVAFLVGWQR